MKQKKIISLLLILILTITSSGCGSNTVKKENEKDKKPINNNNALYDKGYLEVLEEDTKNMEKMTCTRQGNGINGAKANLNYTLYYQGEYLQILHSKEQVLTTNQDILTEYQNAYINIYKNYENLKYYETSIVREEGSVTNDTIINYSKLDTNKLLEIEGEEDNIIKDGKVKLDDWLKFAEKLGTTCEKN